MRYIYSILILFMFTGAEKHTEEKPLIYPRSFFLEMKKLEKPEKVTAFSAVQTANANASTATLNVTVSSTTANNLVVVSIWVLATNTISSVTDNAGNTYAAAINTTTHSSFRVAVYYGFQITGGNTQVTVTLGSGTYLTATVDEFSGFTGTPTNAECFDVSKISTGNSGGAGTISSGNFSPINNDCLIVGFASDANASTLSAGSGYTIYGLGYIAGTLYARTEYKLSSSVPIAATFSTSGAAQWHVTGVSFKQEDAVPPPAAGKAIRSSQF